MNTSSIPAWLPDTTLLWGVFIRALGGVYLLAIAQLYHQILPLAGERGITPVGQKLAHIRAAYPGWRRLVYFPTLLWLVGSSDRMLKGLVLTGSGAALLVIYGGAWTWVGLLVCWLVYLSLDLAVGLSYPWDCLLLEAGFLALLLPGLPPLPNVAALATPLPVVGWAYRWLFFRLLFGFGKYKFWGGSLRDAGYFRNFLVNIPLPTYLAWYAFRLPRWVFQVVLVIVFLAEVVLPFGAFGPISLRIAVALVTMGLMIGIQAVSNFGFFNLMTFILCLTLLDGSTPGIIDTPVALIKAYPLTHAVGLLLAVGGLVNLPFNSWCTFTWLNWPSGLAVRQPLIRGLLRVYRGLLRLRIVHAYGVFPPRGGPPIRWVPVIEGSQDGLTWLPYEYRYTPTTETSRPRVVAPYHPRLDHGIFYESFGTNDANFLWSTMGFGNPFDFAHASGVECLLQRLLENEPGVRGLFRQCPFPADAPPVRVRMTLYRFQPTTPAERRQTGHWWHRTVVGTHLPATALNPHIWQLRWPLPDNFHPDAVRWRRRVPQLRALRQVARTGNLAELWPMAVTGLSVGLADCWPGLIDPVAPDEPQWATLPLAVARLRERYTPRQWQDLETLFNRLTLSLLERLEPHLLGNALPQLPLETYFHLTLFVHHLMGKGPDVYADVWENPARALLYLPDFQPEKSFYYLGLFWYDTLVYQSRKFRLTMPFTDIHTEKALPGFLALIPFISQQFHHPDDEQLPFLHRDSATGAWTILDTAPASYQPA